MSTQQPRGPDFAEGHAASCRWRVARLQWSLTLSRDLVVLFLFVFECSKYGVCGGAVVDWVGQAWALRLTSLAVILTYTQRLEPWTRYVGVAATVGSAWPLWGFLWLSLAQGRPLPLIRLGPEGALLGLLDLHAQERAIGRWGHGVSP